jgi:hypothetical protein
MRKKLLLVVTFLLLLILPLVGSYFKWGGLPPGFGLFPAQKVEEDPPFNQTIFNLFCIGAVFILAFLVFPRLFGFKKPPVSNRKIRTRVSYPSWFVPSIIIMAVSWTVMWARIKEIHPLDHFTFVPLWWSFIFFLDAIVYKRNNGKSLIASRPVTMKLLATASSFSWFVFEYQNFFVLENWYYPNANELSNFGNISWQLLSYTTVLPAIFEFYWLLRTFKPLSERYTYGPRLNFSKPILYGCLVSGLLLAVLMAYFPHELFWVLWVSLIPALVPAMELSGYWNPFTPIGQKGDWSYFVLIALATLLNGFFWEFWNFGSEWFHETQPTNPNYWRYSVPYVDKYYLFSQMPILGYFGYLLFGVVCWLLWLVVAYIVGFDAVVHKEPAEEPVSMSFQEQIPVLNH